MAIFDDYFQEIDNVNLGGTSKFDVLLQAEANKQKELDLKNQAKVNALKQLQQQRTQGENSLAGKLGASQGGYLHKQVNTMASVTSATSRITSNILTAPLDLHSMAQEFGVPEEAFDAYTRYKQNIATPEDLELLNQTGKSENNIYADTHLSNLQSAEKSRGIASDVAETLDISNIVDHRGRNQFSDDLSENSGEDLAKLKQAVGKVGDGEYTEAVTDFVSSGAGLIANAADAILDNPVAVSEYMAEMIPELAVGAYSKVLMGARTLGYGIDNYRKGIEKHQEENNGEYPDEDTRERMAMFALAAAAAEFVGDATILKAGKKANKDLGLKDRALRVVNEGVGGGLTEAATEGFQTYAEGEASLDPASAQDIYEGAVIGAAVGGTISTGLSAGKEIGQGLEAKESVQKEADEVFTKAIDTGDISELTDPNKPDSYNLGKAAAILVARTNNDELSEGEKLESQKKLEELQQEAETRVQEQEANLQALDPSNIKNKESELRVAQERIDNLPESEVEKRANLTEALSLRKEELAEIKGLPKKEIAKRKRALKDSQNQAAIVNEAVKQTVADQAPDISEVDVLVSQAEDTTKPNEQVEAANRVITLMMENPDVLDEATVSRLADSETSGFTAPQRQYLRELSDSQVKRNELQSLDSVNAAITKGIDGYKGIVQYVADLSTAVRNKDQTRATKEVADLSRFSQNHQAKALAAKEALKLAQQVGKSTYLLRDFDSESGWRVSQTKPEGWSQRKNGGLIIHKTGGPIVSKIEKEAELLSSTEAQMRSQYALAFEQPTVAPKQESTVEEPPLAPEFLEPDAVVNTNPEEVVSEPEIEPQEDVSTGEAGAEVQTEVAASETSTLEKETEITKESGELDQLADADQKVTGALNTEEYKKANLLSAYFTQNVGKDTDATLRPLATIKDFSSEWFKDSAIIEFFYENGGEPLDVSSSKFLGTFMGYAKEWAPSFENNLNKKRYNKEYRFKDYIQYFRNDLTSEGDVKPLEEGQSILDENVKTALAFAGFTWLVENSGGNGLNNKEAINSILGRRSDNPVSPIEFAELGSVGTSDKIVIADLGKRAAAALGLKMHKDAPVHTQAQLEGSLGAAVLAVLLQEGMIERIQTNSELLHRGTDPYNPKVKHPFIRVARVNWEGPAADNHTVPELEQISDLSEGASGVLSKVFGTEPAAIVPSFKPEKFNQATTKKTRQLVPKILQRILNKVGKHKHVLRDDMFKVRSALSNESVLQVAKYVETEGFYIQENRRKSIESKNNDIIRDLDRLEEFTNLVLETEKGMKTPFYFLGAVWRQQRVGLLQNLVNPQTSKIQRHNVSMEAWRTEVDTKDPTNETLLKFKQAVAHSMHISTDKMLRTESIAAIEARMSEQEMRKAITALQRVDELADGEKLTDVEQQSIIAAVKSGKEGFYSLDGLVSWAQYETALKDKTTFTTDLMYEVDGVTNGPALAHYLLGAIQGKMGELFGFYGEDSTATSYPEWKAEVGHRDLYETVSLRIVKRIQNMVQTDPRIMDTAPSLSYFTGDLYESTVDEYGKVTNSVTGEGRSFIKQPLTALIFGSGIESATDNMAEDFIDSIYERLEDIANNNSTAENLQIALTHINKLIVSRKDILDVNMSFEQAMELTLTPNQIRGIKRTYSEIIGHNVKEVLELGFGAFVEKRDELNKAAQVTWEIYDTVFNHLKELKIQEKIAAKELPLDGTGNNLQGLTRTEEEVIREQLKSLEPVVHTPMSKLEGGAGLSAGLFMSKIKTGVATDGDITYTGEAKFDKDIQNNPMEVLQYDEKGKPKNTFKGLRTRATRVTEIDPGVATVIMLVHSLDSAIAAYSYERTPSLHVHDAAGYGIKDSQRGAQLLNKNTLKVLAGYSLPLEIHAALERTVTGLDTLLEAHPELAEKLAPVQARIENSPQDDYGVRVTKGMTGDSVLKAIKGFMQMAKTSGLDSEVTKLTNLSEKTSINQYALEGGEFTVTQEISDLIQKKLEGLKQLSAANEVVQKQLTEETSRTKPEVKEEVYEPVKVGDTAWGKLGEPKQDSDPVLVKLFESKPNLTVKELLPVLGQRIKATMSSKRQQQFSLGLLRTLAQTVNADTKINYVTANTPAPTTKLNVKQAKGWYTLDKSGEAINIKSNEYVHSGVTAELLLHELTHGALAQTIDREQHSKKKDSSYTSKALEHINDLESLREVAASYVAAQGLSQFKNAVSNVQELVAWGMTNPAFQRDVLNKVNVVTKTADRSIMSGMRAFIKGMVGILFKGGDKSAQELRENGMAILIANTGLLLEEAQETEGKSRKLLLKQEEVDPLEFSSDEVFRALGQLPGESVTDPSRVRHLRTVLNNVANAAYGPFQHTKLASERAAPLTTTDTFLNSLTAGTLPFASKALAHLKLNNQEAYVLEAVEAAVSESLQGSLKAREELRKLFNEVKSQVTVQDFYTGDMAQAQATYDFIFKLELKEDNTSDFLSRFAAIGLVYPPLNTRLQQLQGRQDNQQYAGKTLSQKLVLLFERLMQQLAYMWTKTDAQMRPNQRLLALSQRLANMEALKKATILRMKDTAGNVVEEGLRSANEKVREGLIKVGRSDFFKNSKSGIIRATGSLTSAVADNSTDKIYEGIERLRNTGFKERLGILASVFNEARGATDSTREFHILLQAANKHEQDRRHIKEDTANLVKKAFKDKLTKVELDDLTQVIVRTDMAALIDQFDQEELRTFLSNPTALDTAIKAMEQQLNGRYSGYYKDAGKALAHYMVTGYTAYDHLMLNTHNIVFLGGTSEMANVSEAQGNAANAILNPLVSLYALKYVPENQKRTVSNILIAEQSRTDGGNGISLLLKLHKKLQEEAKDTLFDNNPVHIIKGYTKDILNPHIDVVAAGESAITTLQRARYSEGMALSKDPADPDLESKRLYVMKDGGLQPFVSGIASNTGKRRRGSPVHAGITSVTHDSIYQGNARKNQQVRQTKAHKVSQLLKSPGNFDPTQARGTRLVPVLDDSGQAVNYRYVMNNATKDTLMERDNRVDQVMGTMASSAFDKVETENKNKILIEALYSQYRNEYAERPEGYLEFSAQSTDPSIRETYNLLPESTKKEIRRVWGRNGMLVRNDLLDMTFGYRKASIADMFENNSSERNMAAQVLVEFVNQHFGPEFARKLRKAEDVWQTAVKMIKDIWIIKNLFTLLGNMASNTTALFWFGVPIKDVVKNHVVALLGITNYQRDSKELFKLQRMLDADYIQGNRADMEQRVTELTDAIERNPVKELIDAGLFQTIVEDFDQEEDQYSFKSRLTRKLDERTQWAPEGLKTATKTLFMTHDTPLYKVLNRATQLSDFIARYTLHQHMTTRKVNPMSREDSLQLAVEAFVNYDIPTHRRIQYLNDMGVLWFTKYYLRIQKVLFHLWKEEPARAMALMAMGNYLSEYGNIMDSGFWGRLGNSPLSTGAFELPGAVDEILTVNAALSVVD